MSQSQGTGLIVSQSRGPKPHFALLARARGRVEDQCHTLHFLQLFHMFSYGVISHWIEDQSQRWARVEDHNQDWLWARVEDQSRILHFLQAWEPESRTSATLCTSCKCPSRGPVPCIALLASSRLGLRTSAARTCTSCNYSPKLSQQIQLLEKFLVTKRKSEGSKKRMETF